MYHDCPSISVSKGVRRSKTLYLQGVSCIPDVETCGKSQLWSVRSQQAKQSVVRTTKLLDKDYETLECALKCVKIRRRDAVEFFLCKQRKGLPTPVAEAVLEFLV